MKKLLLLLTMTLVVVASYSQGAPQVTKSYSFTSATTSTGFVIPDGINKFRLAWRTPKYVLTACTVSLEGSIDNVTFSSTTLVQAQTCTADGASAIVSAQSANSYARVNVSAYTGIGVLNVTVDGWKEITNAVTTDIDTFPTAVTTTARNLDDASVVEKGGRWGVTVTTGAGTQGTITIAAEAGVRHVVDCVSWTASATTAPSLTAVTINLRDGATGAGTVLQSWTHVLAASTGQLIPLSGVCGLQLPGTTNTAMTLEFASGTANVLESVNMTGFNIN